MVDQQKLYSDYVRRLGQWHLCDALKSDGKTLCGKPMLSPNRADYMPVEERQKCWACFAAANMEPNHWRIDQDRIEGTQPPEPGLPIWTSQGFPHELMAEKGMVQLPIRFLLLDDDGKVYFSGRMATADFEPLDDFGRGFGCTELRYNEKGEWKVL